MCLHKFYQRAIRIFYVGKLSCRIAHVKGATFFKLLSGIHGKRMSFFSTEFPQFLHIPDIKANLNKARIAPESSFVELAGCTLQCLYKFDVRWSEQFAECSFTWFGMRKQSTMEFLIARWQSVKIGKNTCFIGNNGVVTQNIPINRHCFFNIGHTDSCTHSTAREPTFILENIIVVHNLKQISVRIFHVESLHSVQISAQSGNNIHFRVSGKLFERFCDIFTFYFANQHA